jgi:hypothetical protein
MALLALLLALLPVVAWRYARTHIPRHTWLITGFAFGLVVSPLSLGLYATYFVSPLGFPTGMLGLVSMLFHGAPGYQTAIWLGLLPSHEVISGWSTVYVEVLNGIIWAPVYGIVGFVADWGVDAYSQKAT